MRSLFLFGTFVAACVELAAFSSGVVTLPPTFGTAAAVASTTRFAAAPRFAFGASRSTRYSARAHAVTSRSIPLCVSTTIVRSATCDVLRVISIPSIANPLAPLSSLVGYAPSELATAYGLSGSSGLGSGQAVGIVVAYHNATLETDLNVYRSAFGLGRCSVANGCLHYAMDSAPLSAQPSWAAESDLDVEMVSALCPRCRIVLSEARSTDIGDLAAAADAAVAAGATVVSNSYTIAESAANDAYAKSYAHPRVPMTAGAGDGGYAVGFPASLATVVAVGGTTLEQNGSGFVQSAWNGTGSGCSAYESKPAWQHDSGCAHRTLNDLAVVGDPSTGVETFVTALGGWNVLGGTSVGAPIVAAMYALAGNAAAVASPGTLYAHANAFRALAGGANGSCATTYLCTASFGYNGPGGLGTPYGLQAF